MGTRLLLPVVMLVAIVALVAVPAVNASDSRPAVSPVTATFDPKHKATFYEVIARSGDAGEKLSYAWSLAPPKDDPGCKAFTALGSPDSAVWRHSDEHGCTHKGAEHGGVVSVVVSNRTWSCTAIFNGSGSGRGPKPTCGHGGVGSKKLLLRDLRVIHRRISKALERSKTKPSLGSAAVDGIFDALKDNMPAVFGVPFARVFHPLVGVDARLAMAIQDAMAGKDEWAAYRIASASRSVGLVFDDPGGTTAPAELVLAMRKLGADLKLLGQAASKGKISRGALVRALKGFERRKHALVKRFPTVLGIPYFDLLRRFPAVKYDTLFHATPVNPLREFEREIETLERLVKDKADG